MFSVLVTMVFYGNKMPSFIFRPLDLVDLKLPVAVRMELLYLILP